jgi:hypothetical protein
MKSTEGSGFSVQSLEWAGSGDRGGCRLTSRRVSVSSAPSARSQRSSGQRGWRGTTPGLEPLLPKQEQEQEQEEESSTLGLPPHKAFEQALCRHPLTGQSRH